MKNWRVAITYKVEAETEDEALEEIGLLLATADMPECADIFVREATDGV